MTCDKLSCELGHRGLKVSERASFQRGRYPSALNDAGHRTESGSLWSHATDSRVIEKLGL